MLAILLGFFYWSGVNAQDFTQSNSEYNISQYQVVSASQFSSHDPTIDLTMECLAANGYGQWTVTSNAGSLGTISGHPWLINPDPSYDHGNGWYLLSNILAKPSEKFSSNFPFDHPGCQPPGIVAGGHFNSGFPSTNPKATANLYGQVRYVWIESVNRTSFIIQGLNDRFTSTSPQIDISMAGMPNPEINTQVIKSAISTLTLGGTNDGTGNKAVINTGDWRDQFDIACDKAFLYIVWTHLGGTGKTEIYATAVDINTGSVGSGLAPFKVDGNGTINFNNPTVACDVRYNGSSGPQFDVGYIGSSSATNGTVIVKSFAGSTTPAFNEPLGKTCHDPFAAAPATFTYTGASHARVLVSSISGSSSLTHSVYVLDNINSGVDDDIILYQNLSWTGDVAFYVDGVHNTTSYPDIINSLMARPLLSGILDKPIIAYGNPYDAQNSTPATFDQFHCLYQAVYSGGSPSASKPLQLIRGHSNGFPFPAATTDTRLLLNQDNFGPANTPEIQFDPDWYVAAINQMGAHIHWFVNFTGFFVHFYARDRRYFDEPIEENTLVTNDCYLADGSSTGSNHGGTVGAALVNSKTMTIWSDPNYGAVSGSTLSGIYTTYPHNSSNVPFWYGGRNIGSLSFGFNHITTASMGLTIGESSAIESATLVTMPVCLFSSYALGCTPFIQIEPTSTWECYQTSQFDPGSITVNLGIPGASSTANLNIHGGGNFYFSPIVGNIGAIDIKFEPNLAPENLSTSTSSTNTNASGLLTINQNSNLLDHCTVTSHIPSGSVTVVTQIDGTNGVVTDSRVTLNSNTTDYTNDQNGVGIIQYNNTGNGCKSPDKVTFNHGTITRDRFHGIDPIANLTIQNLTFNQISDKEIFIERSSCSDANSDPYGQIAINSNTFGAIAGLGSVSDQFGIYVKGFNLSADFGHLNVNSNIFTNTSNASGNMQAAIAFENSTGNVESNTISDDGYLIGIDLFSSGSLLTTHSYLCNNTISGLAGGSLIQGVGIESAHYNGYVKLNTISSCSVGYVSKDNDNPMLAFTSITNCSDEGIHTSSGSAEVDLSGVHGTSSGGDDYSAPNTIKNNGGTFSTATQIALTVNSLVDYGNINGITWWTDWGKNNTEGATGKPFIRCTTSPVTAWSINNIDNNFWKAGTTVIDPAVTSTNFLDVTYGASTGASLGTEQTFSGVTCSGGFINKNKNPKPLAALVDTASECTILRQWRGGSPHSATEYQQQFDSLRKYIEICANDVGSSHAFKKLLDDCQESSSTDTTRYDRFRDWCISVLYLNTTDPYYFCADLGVILSTYQYGKWKIPNASLTIMKYLMNNSFCNDQGLQDDYNNTIRSRHDSWLTLHNDGDTSAKEDTILPSLDKLGLGFLLKNDVHGQLTPLPCQYLASFTVSQNPFKDETKLRFSLNRMAYTTIDIFDELGRPYYGNGTGRTFEAGDQEVVIDGRSLPSGTLYARISTGFGEVKTVKLVHEK